MKETEAPQRTLQEAMTTVLQKQTRDILVLYYKQNFPAKTISKIFSIELAEVEKIISNFAEAFSSKALMMSVVDNIVRMNAVTSMKKDSINAPSDSKDAEIAKLRRQLTEAQIKAEAYQEMIRVAEDRFRIPIRKKSGAK